MKRSRPQGLGASLSSVKKEKPDDEVVENVNEVSQDKGVEVVNEPARTFFELPEDATALDQLKALFEFSQMNSDDPGKVTPILNGIINECMRLENIKETNEAPEEQAGDSDDIDSFTSIKRDSDRIFVPEFYFYFGESLRLLALFEMDSVAQENDSYDYVTGLLSKSQAVLIEAYHTIHLNENDNSSLSIKKEIEESLGMVLIYLNVLTTSNNSDNVKESLDNFNLKFDLSLLENSLTDVINYSYSLIENYSDSLPEDFKDNLLNNLNSLDEKASFTCLKESLRVKISKIDVPFRFLVSESSSEGSDNEESQEETEISTQEKQQCVEFSVQLRALLDSIDNFTLEDEEKKAYRYEMLMLLGSILEWTEEDEEAQKIYNQADALGFTN